MNTATSTTTGKNSYAAVISGQLAAAGLVLLTPAAHDVQQADLISVRHDWCTVQEISVVRAYGEIPASVEMILRALDGRLIDYSILASENVAVLRPAITPRFVPAIDPMPRHPSFPWFVRDNATGRPYAPQGARSHTVCPGLGSARHLADRLNADEDAAAAAERAS
jgi:hypothetical protein